jgi:hypothetical protein
MKKPIITRWYVKLIIVIFCVLVAYLAVKSFQSGVAEAEHQKVNVGGK